MTNSVDASIVVPCRNEARHIRPFLESVLGQELAGTPVEVIVADGLSDDGTRDILAEYCGRYPQLTVIDNPHRTVPSALNLAIRSARGTIILRMDVHTRYASDYVLRCLQELTARDADNVGGPARTETSGFLAGAIAAAYHSPYSCGGARFHDDNFEGYVDTVPYGCWRKSTLERLGLFDETFVRNQDDELNLRIVRAGGRIWQSPAIASWYSPRPDLSRLFDQYFQYGFWKVRVIQKHRIPASIRHLIPAAFVLANAVLALAAAAALIGQWPTLLTVVLTGWATMLLAYLTLSLVSATVASRRHGWRLLPLLPVVFAVYHVSYGLGFLTGVVFWNNPRAAAKAATGRFSRLTR